MTDYSRISAKLGRRHYLGSIIHDDGQHQSDGGGKSTAMFSSPGKGKSTLLCQNAQLSKYVYGSKKDAINALVSGEGLESIKFFLETGLWRIRDFDAFANIIPQNWSASFKGRWTSSVKDCHVWVHEDDDVIFYSLNHKKQAIPVKNLPDIEYYKSADDLMKRLHWGANNAVLEPQTYKLSPTLIQRLREKRMDVDDDTREQNEDDDRVSRRRADKTKPLQERGERAPRKKNKRGAAEYEHREVSPAYFWFDMIHTAMENNKTKHITFYIDEWDDIAEARSEGDVWKLIDVLASDWKTLRKVNISTQLSTHQTDYVDWRILKRIDYFLWMKGAIIHPSYSMLTSQNVVSDLPMGMFIIEEKKVSFGVSEFDKIPYNQPTVRIDGLKGQTLRLSNAEANSILKTKAQESTAEKMQDRVQVEA